MKCAWHEREGRVDVPTGGLDRAGVSSECGDAKNVTGKSVGQIAPLSGSTVYRNVGLERIGHSDVRLIPSDTITPRSRVG